MVLRTIRAASARSRIVASLLVALVVALATVTPVFANYASLSGGGCTGSGYTVWYEGDLRNGTYTTSSCLAVWLQPSGHIDGISGWVNKPWQDGIGTTYYQWPAAYTDSDAAHQVCDVNCTDIGVTWEYSGTGNG
jgi:hypothetical protein